MPGLGAVKIPVMAGRLGTMARAIALLLSQTRLNWQGKALGLALRISWFGSCLSPFLGYSESMDIADMSIAMHQSQVADNVAVALLSRSLSLAKDQSAALAKLMDAVPSPVPQAEGSGSLIDILA